jgi:hypothetical protein
MFDIGRSEQQLFRLWQASRIGRRASALWKVLERVLRNIKQGANTAVEDERSDKPF